MKNNTLHHIRNFWENRLGDFLSESRISAIFENECTNNLFFNQDKKFGNLDLVSVQSITCYIFMENKRIPGYDQESFTKMSDVLVDYFSEGIVDSQLMKNFSILENWAQNTLENVTNFIEDSAILKEKLDSVLNISNFSDEEQINAFIDVFEKKFDRDDIMSAIKTNPTKFNLITLKQLLIQKMIKNTNITYYSYKLMFEDQLEIQSYDQLSKFELYHNICH